MSYMVSFRSAEGKPGYHPTESLEDAVRFVEHLRNQEQLTDARILRVQEVPITVKTVYRVEVVAAGSEPVPAQGAEDDRAKVEVGVAAGATTAAGATGAAPAAGADGTIPGGGGAARFSRFNRT